MRLILEIWQYIIMFIEIDSAHKGLYDQSISLIALWLMHSFINISADLLKPKFMKDRRQVNSTSSKPAYSSVMIGQPMGSEGEGMQENAGYLGNDTQSFDFDAMINDQPYPNDWQRASFGRKRKNRNRHQRHKRSFDELQGQGPSKWYLNTH